MAKLRDYKDRDISASDEAWTHIQEEHQEILFEDIQTTLLHPDFVQVDEQWKPSSECETELFYQKKLSGLEISQYIIVVVKFCPDGNFLQTAYTVRKLKKRKLIYEKDKGEIK